MEERLSAAEVLQRGNNRCDACLKRLDELVQGTDPPGAFDVERYETVLEVNFFRPSSGPCFIDFFANALSPHGGRYQQDCRTCGRSWGFVYPPGGRHARLTIGFETSPERAELARQEWEKRQPVEFSEADRGRERARREQLSQPVIPTAGSFSPSRKPAPDSPPQAHSPLQKAGALFPHLLGHRTGPLSPYDGDYHLSTYLRSSLAETLKDHGLQDEETIYVLVATDTGLEERERWRARNAGITWKRTALLARDEVKHLVESALSITQLDSPAGGELYLLEAWASQLRAERYEQGFPVRISVLVPRVAKLFTPSVFGTHVQLPG